MSRQWAAGDKEPPNSEVRQVRGASGQIWRRSPPNGLFWYPRGGGLTRDWAEVLDLDGPVTADDTAPSTPEKQCGREGCERKHAAKGLCRTHYSRRNNFERYRSDPAYRERVNRKRRERRAQLRQAPDTPMDD